MAIFKALSKEREFYAHHDLLSNCSSVIAEALEASARGLETRFVNLDADEWLLELFQQWLYFGDWKWPCNDMRNSNYREQHEHDDGCDSAPTQVEIVEVISFANNYEILDLLQDASELLCEELNSGEGVDENAIFVAQSKLCRFSPVLKVIAEAYAMCGTLDGVEYMFYEGLKPSFIRVVMFEFSQLRDNEAGKTQT